MLYSLFFKNKAATDCGRQLLPEPVAKLEINNEVNIFFFCCNFWLVSLKLIESLCYDHSVWRTDGLKQFVSASSSVNSNMSLHTKFISTLNKFICTN